ncbi:MAG: 16S rRNA (cytosine(1402)-N(4))-methyltransferase, partial [Bacteroidales bacterium]|nr:16S rRNA (cytosine(1402)-N(4))-methyltransferase [Bacteroidales bacterium]
MTDEPKENAVPHKRRPHYSGKYPRHFAEKYKELNPEKYGDMAEHIIGKGGTPAGTHLPIMVEEILDVLKIQPGEQGYDATLGYGGHTSRMLAVLNHTGRLYSGDADPLELAKTTARLRAQGWTEEDFVPRHMNFAQLD